MALGVFPAWTRQSASLHIELAVISSTEAWTCSVNSLKKSLSKLRVDRGGKRSHRNFLHPSGVKITLSGAPGDDAKHYQERDLKRAIQKVQS